MDHLDSRAIASILTTTSTSSLAGLLCADHAYKERAATSIARDIVNRLNRPQQPDRNQLALPF